MCFHHRKLKHDYSKQVCTNQLVLTLQFSSFYFQHISWTIWYYDLRLWQIKVEKTVCFSCVSPKITCTQIKFFYFSLLVKLTSNSFSSKIFIISKGTKLANPFIKDFICASILDINRHWITKLQLKEDYTYINLELFREHKLIAFSFFIKKFLF